MTDLEHHSVSGAKGWRVGTQHLHKLEKPLGTRCISHMHVSCLLSPTATEDNIAWLILPKPMLPFLSSTMHMHCQRLGLITAEAAVCRKEVSSGRLHSEACGRDNGTVEHGSDGASRSSEPGASAHTGPSGHADVLCLSSKRARTDDVQPPPYSAVGQWEPTDIVNLLPQCTADRSAVFRPLAHLTACSVSHAQPAAALPLWLEQVRGVQEQQRPDQVSVAEGGHRLAVPLLAAHVMQLPQQSLAASMAHPGQPELLPSQQQQPHSTPAMLQHQPYQASPVLGQQPLQSCQQQKGGCGIPPLPIVHRQMAQQPAQDMAMQHELTLAGQQQHVKLLHQQLLATAAALGVAVQEADAAEMLQQQYRSLQR